MTDLKKLFETGNALERELVESARYDGLSQASRTRHMRLFGMSGALLALLSYARFSAAAVAGASKSTLLIFGGVALAGIGVGTYAVQASSTSSSSSGAASAPNDAPSLPTRPEAAEPSDAYEPSPPATSAAATAPVMPTVGKSRDGVVTKAEQAQRLQKETALLMGVHELLRSGQTQAAQERLRNYRSQFPSGQLRLEAEVVDVELMSASGDRARAARRAKALLAAGTVGPYSARLRAIEAAVNAREPAK